MPKTKSQILYDDIKSGRIEVNRTSSTLLRFWKAVNKDGPVVMEALGKCWAWEGRINEKGYGLISDRGVLIKAHRLSWTLHSGKINDGLHVLHRCDNRGCVNPAHLFLGTHQDNMKDMVEKDQQHGFLTREQELDVVKRYRRGIGGHGPRYRGNSKELAAEFDVPVGAITRVIRRYKQKGLAPPTL